MLLYMCKMRREDLFLDFIQKATRSGVKSNPVGCCIKFIQKQPTLGCYRISINRFSLKHVLVLVLVLALVLALVLVLVLV